LTSRRTLLAHHGVLSLNNTDKQLLHARWMLRRFYSSLSSSSHVLRSASAMARLNIPKRSPSTDSLYRDPTPAATQRRSHAAGTFHTTDSPAPSFSSDKENHYDGAIQPTKSTSRFKSPMPPNQNSSQHGNKRRRIDNRETPISELLSQYPRSESGNERFFNPMQDVDLRRGLRAQMRTHTRELHGTFLIKHCCFGAFGLTLSRSEERVSA
jgi:hypothetical protein